MVGWKRRGRWPWLRLTSNVPAWPSLPHRAAHRGGWRCQATRQELQRAKPPSRLTQGGANVRDRAQEAKTSQASQQNTQKCVPQGIMRGNVQNGKWQRRRHRGDKKAAQQSSLPSTAKRALAAKRAFPTPVGGWSPPTIRCTGRQRLGRGRGPHEGSAGPAATPRPRLPPPARGGRRPPAKATDRRGPKGMEGPEGGAAAHFSPDQGGAKKWVIWGGGPKEIPPSGSPSSQGSGPTCPPPTGKGVPAFPSLASRQTAEHSHRER